MYKNIYLYISVICFFAPAFAFFKKDKREGALYYVHFN